MKLALIFLLVQASPGRNSAQPMPRGRCATGRSERKAMQRSSILRFIRSSPALNAAQSTLGAAA